MKIKVRILKPVLITNESGPLIDVSASALLKGPKVIEVHDSAYLRQAIMKRPECEFIGVIEEKQEEINPETGKPYTKKELKEKADREAAGGTDEKTN
jgi:hypothetical protein